MRLNLLNYFLFRNIRVLLGPFLAYVMAGITLLLLMILMAQLGAVRIDLIDWMAMFDGNQQVEMGSSYVLWYLRLPRIIFAFSVGSVLGLSGALTQALFRNPLADPGLLGVSAGAACAVALGIVVLADLNGLIDSHFATDISSIWRVGILPTFAFIGAISVCFILDRLARWITPGSISGLLLTGIALNTLAAAIIGLCTYLATDEQLRNLTFWTMGSLAGSNWGLVLTLFCLSLIAWFRLRSLLELMNVFALGESVAAHLGIDVDRIRREVIIWVALLTGFTVSWCGMIGFIGLIAPNLARTCLGGDQRLVIPAAMITGGVLLLIADTFARTVAIPAEVPVGIFTALLGAPFFILLLRAKRQKFV